MTRVMIFYDLQNFKVSLIKRDNNRFYDYGKFQYFIIEFLENVLRMKSCNEESLVRAYAYTGEYNNKIIKRIERELENLLEEKGVDIQELEKEENKEKEDFSELLQKNEFLKDTRRRFASQQSLFKRMEGFNYFQLRTYPLKYENGRIFQKGVDVQLAVDLASHGYKDNFDVAVVCSGDIDLIESVKMVKDLGKKVVIVSHWDLMAKGLRKVSDFFIDIAKFTDENLDRFSNRRTNRNH